MTGLNQLKLKCCDVPNPGICEPTQFKIFLQTCNNSDAEVSRPCPFETNVGIVYNKNKYEKAAKFYESVGHSLKETLPQIRESIERTTNCTLEGESDCEQKWKEINDKNDKIYKTGKKDSGEIKLKPGAVLKLYQTTVSCGIYRMYTNQIIAEGDDLTASEIFLF